MKRRLVSDSGIPAAVAPSEQAVEFRCGEGTMRDFWVTDARAGSNGGPVSSSRVACSALALRWNSKREQMVWWKIMTLPPIAIHVAEVTVGLENFRFSIAIPNVVKHRQGLI